MDSQYLPDDLIKMIMDINTKEIKKEKNDYEKNKEIHKKKFMNDFILEWAADLDCYEDNGEEEWHSIISCFKGLYLNYEWSDGTWHDPRCNDWT